MGISLLAPAFLVALAAIAIPILVHLTHRHRRDVTRFPSLQFLERVPYRAVRRQRIRHWLLFAARSLAIVLLVVAFARPFVDRLGAGAAGGGGGTEVALLMDRSYSMSYGDSWDRARRAAREALDAVGPDDRVSLITFADDAVIAVEATADPAVIRQVLDTMTASVGRTRYAPALQLARQIAARSDLSRRQAVLISDFQDSGWDRSADVSLPKGVEFRAVDVSTRESANVLVADARIQRSGRSGGGREEVFVLARVVNQGEAPVRAHRVALEIDGREVERRDVALDARGAATVRFGPVPQPASKARATVRSADDALLADNAFHFVLPPRPTVSLLSVEGAGRTSRRSLYLRQALEISHEPAFLVQSKHGDQVRVQDLSGRAMVVLNGAPFPRGAVGRALVEFVRNGGGLWIVLGQGSALESWPTEARPLLPGTWSEPVDRVPREGTALGTIEYGHPVFAIFSAPESGDLSSPRFFRYRVIEMDTAGVVLARFADGSVALAERHHGKGKTLVLASALDNLWNDLPVQPVYLPLVHQVARYLGGRNIEQPWYQAGQIIDAALFQQTQEDDPAEGAGGDLVVESPSGARVSISMEGADRFVSLLDPGFYGLRRGGRRVDAHPIAVNADRSESDRRALDTEELGAAVTATRDPEAATVPFTAPAGMLTLAERERRQNMWWYILIVALVVLVAESVASNRLPAHSARLERHQEAPRG